MPQLVIKCLSKDSTEEKLKEILNQKDFRIINVNIELVFTVDKGFQHFAFINFQTEEAVIVAQDLFDNNEYFSSLKIQQCTKPAKRKENFDYVYPLNKTYKKLKLCEKSIGKDSSLISTSPLPSLNAMEDKNGITKLTNNHIISVLNDKTSSNTSKAVSIESTLKKQVKSEFIENQTIVSSAKESTSLNYATSMFIQKQNDNEFKDKLDSEKNNKIIKLHDNVEECNQKHNYDDIMCSLLTNYKCIIHTKQDKFIKIILFEALRTNSITRTLVGKMIAELLSKKVLSLPVITQEIDTIFKNWIDYVVDYPYLFSYTAAIVAPLLISKTAAFEFINLRDFCISLSPDISCEFFLKVLEEILKSKEINNIEDPIGNIVWIYNKWIMSEYIPLNAFIPNNNMNKYFKNDPIGVFLLSVMIYDKMRSINNSLILFDIMNYWINTNISAEIIACPHFVKALTITIVILCLKKPNYSFDCFFDFDHVKLLTYYIRLKSLPETGIQARKLEFLSSIQTISSMFGNPKGMISALSIVI